MKILVSCIPFDRGKSGISVYMREVIAALRAQGHDLTLLVEPGAEGFFPGYRTAAAPGWTRRAVFSMLYHLFVLPFTLRRYGCDWCLIAAANRRAFAFYPEFTVAVVHDLAQYHVANKYDRLRMFYLKKVLPFFIRRAPQTVAISRSTADDMTKFWRVRPDRIAVIYNGLTLCGAETPGWLTRTGLTPGRYILYVSRIEHPGKNHIHLIQAYEGLPPEVRSEYRLVLAGSDWHGAAEVHAAAEASPAREGIVFAGFVENGELPEAYRNAAVYVFPSYFEGFGLSLIEAMHYGVPCCCSNNSSLGEIGAGAARCFAPGDPSAIRSALLAVLTDPAEREKLIAAGKTRAAEFDWNDHARKLTELAEKWTQKA